MFDGTNDGIILELERKPCETFLSVGSHTALKFLAALNQDLISALRGADQRLLAAQRHRACGVYGLNARCL